VETSYNATEPHDMLIRTAKLGQALAETFLTVGNASANPPVTEPDYTVVLMRRHGFTTAAADIQTAVFQAVFTQANAKVQTTAALMRGAFQSLSANEARAWTGTSDGSALSAFEPLTAREAKDCEVSIVATSDRPWGLWLKEVENDSLYTNNVQV
jgi:hypothetical protein